MYILRDYQEAAIETAFDKLENNNKALLIIPTGGGKSLINAEIVRRYLIDNPTHKVVCIVNTLELVQQNIQHINDVGLECAIYTGMNKGDKNAQIIVGSSQTIAKVQSIIYKADLIIVDECESLDFKSKNYGTVLKNMTPDTKLIGLTATPYTLSRGHLAKGDNRIFEQIDYEVSLTKLTKEEYLVPIIFRFGSEKLNIDTSKLATTKNSFVQKSINSYVANHDLVGPHIKIAKDLLVNKGKKHGMIFAASIDHANQLYDEAIAIGIKAIVITGKLDAKTRAKFIQNILDHKVELVINVNVLLKGFNFPALDFILFMRPTKSKGVFIQAIGRAARKAKGKEYAIVIDFVDAIDTLGSPYDTTYESPDISLDIDTTVTSTQKIEAIKAARAKRALMIAEANTKLLADRKAAEEDAEEARLERLAKYKARVELDSTLPPISAKQAADLEEYVNACSLANRTRLGKEPSVIVRKKSSIFDTTPRNDLTKFYCTHSEARVILTREGTIAVQANITGDSLEYGHEVVYRVQLNLMHSNEFAKKHAKRELTELIQPNNPNTFFKTLYEGIHTIEVQQHLINLINRKTINNFFTVSYSANDRINEKYPKLKRVK